MDQQPLYYFKYFGAYKLYSDDELYEANDRINISRQNAISIENMF